MVASLACPRRRITAGLRAGDATKIGHVTQVMPSFLRGLVQAFERLGAYRGWSVAVPDRVDLVDQGPDFGLVEVVAQARHC